MTAVLAVEGVQRRIGSRVVVDDVSFAVAVGELVALVGPSGCGKSTLLRVVAGLDASAAGRVVLGGTDVTGCAPERRRIGLVFQDHALFPHLRVDQNVAFGLRALDRRGRAARVQEMLELVRLPEAGRRYPHELSGGEQQRIALARALAPEPDVVLLDEPFASLDASLRDELRADVVAALRTQGTAAVLVTHDREEALALGDRVAVMEQGRLLQIDEPDAVYERPVSRFVARFLGEASFLDAPDGSVLMARPHDLSIVPGGDSVVVARRYLGAVWRHEVRRPDGSVVVVDASSEVALHAGAPCTVEVTASHPLHRVA